ncbi:hypothetical protein CONPUDRAFT_133042 [Coniophora puteana RWD-64-598 SS2]|uniref:Oxysterol-binding protein n=1 Tax=Coniophora puteana (strain RWD-64-598) TaxID=741705 RepID=R7SH35_CONPW|nr:uncharacterized protein CONPUDRAFT_133042 [Coniophora puteana RWD-64-598 SS2]EIW74369.1 hypothetical protein CONPUDRAFT_133042 [Coniophora puteana RWD-64-598 SS2]
MATQDKATINNTPEAAVEDEAPAISVPDAGDSGEGGKLKMISQLVKKSLGVKDIAAMRLSLPASLLEPIPNLEYWHYLDRPDLFAAINDSNDAFERMLAVVRFTFTKDLKFVHGKVCKPYNSVLGEHFRAHWDVPPVQYPSDPTQPPIVRTHVVHGTTGGTAITGGSTMSVPIPSETLSVRSGRSSKSTRSALSLRNTKSATSPSTAATSPLPASGALDPSLPGQMSSLSLGEGEDAAAEGEDTVRITYLTEQVSHHPPVSAYHAACPERGVELCGIDQISAKISGTAVRVAPGAFNRGVFVRITDGAGKGEKYHITHPIASVNGILRGSFYITVGDSTIVTCTGGEGREAANLRAVIEYKEESWIGKSRFLVEAVIHTYDPRGTEHEAWTKVKHVPQSRVLAVFDGCWRTHIRWKRVANFSPPSPSSSSSSTPSGGSSSSSATSSASTSPSPGAGTSTTSLQGEADWAPLVDLASLHVVPKRVRPLGKQDEYESRKLWEPVTSRLVKKEYGEATKHKLAIEQRQRDRAAERKRVGEEFVPKYFEEDITTGEPVLTDAGRKALEEELAEEEDGPAVAESS